MEYCYWRTYIYRGKNEGGYYPLDIELGLPCDVFSMLVRSYAARLATKMSYAQCCPSCCSRIHQMQRPGTRNSGLS